MLLLTMAAWGAERSGSLTSLRMSLHNAMSPGRLAVLAIAPIEIHRQPAKAGQGSDEVGSLQNALLQNELQRRQLLIDNARLNNELRDLRRLTEIRSVSGASLVDFVALKATVLSHSGLPGILTEAFIDAGKTQGLQRSQLVVSGFGIVIDKGADYGLSPGQKVTHGTAVIGRISNVSKWVGVVQPVTHEAFSAAVQIVKLKDHGASFGAKGLLEGTGDRLCKITGVPYTEAVSVGDEVFSGNLQGVNGPRLYYGKVVHAEFSAGGEWDIHVAPAFHAETLDEVAVVQQRLNVDRIQHQSLTVSNQSGAER